MFYLARARHGVTLTMNDYDNSSVVSRPRRDFNQISRGKTSTNFAGETPSRFGGVAAGFIANPSRTKALSRFCPLEPVVRWVNGVARCLPVVQKRVRSSVVRCQCWRHAAD